VTAHQDADDKLRVGFQSLSADSPGDCSDADVERVWRAVSGELPADERREVVDRMASQPAVAEAWRVAHELRQAQLEGSPLHAVKTTRSWVPAWIGLAALLVLTVGVGLVRFSQAPADTFRDGGSYVVESLVESDRTLPRDAFVLRWKPGPEGSRYQVRVTTEDLRVLTTAADLTSPELTVSRELLSEVGPGGRVLWQVVMALPGGESVSSPTFVVRAQ
jgi:hypothetical protein